MNHKILNWGFALATFVAGACMTSAHALTVEKNKGVALQLDKNASEVFVANPDIADAVMPKAPTLYVYGRKVGSTTVYVKDGSGNPKEIPVTVTHNLSQMNQNIKQLHPHDDVKAVSTPSGIMLTGSVSSPKASADIENIAKQYIDEAAKEKVVNHTSISSSTQVMLKVKIAEVRRDVLNSLGVNWGASIPGAADHFTYGILTGRAPLLTNTGASPLSGDGLFGRSNDSQNVFGSLGVQFRDGTNQYNAVLDALNRESMGTILAEPTLLSLSGETASFLVGGEFPVPVPSGTSNQITIEFKQFGVLLSFVPTILQNNQINLRVRPEVSEIDNSTQISILGTDVPGLRTRRAETSLELASGQSMAIAGLFSNNFRNQVSSLPGLAELPILGALFKSTTFQRNQTELVIIVTPIVVEGKKSNDLSLPTDTFRHANVLEMLFYGSVNDPDPAAHVHPVGHIHGAGGFYVE